ncbi:cyclophilin-like fold protein [Rhizobium tumorigenes]|uniref:cyclophilin-like fold protein n=1 Tax=Rhizobium tumorigenes TaxID=2041385 RepID=UPI00241F663F|nr:cyclophilin-like fold protein [Rhizobium tumorigenes]WFS04114.1 cyclophilin-like fold protein [Rhizobium tumorigenes]
MSKTILASAVVALGLAGPAMAQESIRISCAWGEVTATLADNQAARSLARMLPLTIEMSDHLRQEKTGDLPSALPELTRQRDFSVGTLGLWNADNFVIYYRTGRVPAPGIIILGQVTGDVAIFDRPGSVTVKLEVVN